MSSAGMLKAGLPGSSRFSLAQIFFATEVGDKDAMAKHCCRADKTSLKADEGLSKVSLS